MIPKKLYKLCDRINIDVPNTEGSFYFNHMIHQIYTILGNYRKNFHHFFKILSPREYIQLVFLIFSKKTTGDYGLANLIDQNLFFFEIIQSTNEKAEIDCSECEGTGRETCPDCDGETTVPCDACDSDGKVECYHCDGAGEIEVDDGEFRKCNDCSGEGLVDCSECGGIGKIPCHTCDEIGHVYCDTCDGSGLVLDENIYKVLDCCYWKKDLIPYLIDSLELNEPIREIDPNLFFVLSEREFISSVEMDADNYYCTFYDTNPNLIIKDKSNKPYFKIIINNRIDIKEYLDNVDYK